MSAFWLLALAVVSYGVTLWLGGYLLAKDAGRPLLGYTGLGLMSYALAFAAFALAGVTGSSLLLRLQSALSFLPATLWTGAFLHLLPDTPTRDACLKVWRYSLLPLTGLLAVLAVSTPALLDPGGTPNGSTYLVLILAVMAPLLGAFVLVVRELPRGVSGRPFGFLLVVTLFFALALGLLLLPFELLPRSLTLTAMGADLLLLGLGVALFDAFDEGEALLADLGRSGLGAALLSLLLGSQVMVAMVATSASPELVTLLFGVLAVAVLLQVFGDALQGALDRLVFRRAPGVRRGRADLRAVSSALPRINDALVPVALSDEEFARLTRRALSHFGDLSRLAASPLIRLPILGERLGERNADDTLERAQELRRLLVESIVKLKPDDDAPFGAGAEWRYYNVLFFPYVLGVKPFSRRTDAGTLDATAREALEWFRTHVPERTFYNWQKAAADLVAQDLRERHQVPDR